MQLPTAFYFDHDDWASPLQTSHNFYATFYLLNTPTTWGALQLSIISQVYQGIRFFQIKNLKIIFTHK
jgi:hypothetical protein